MKNPIQLRIVVLILVILTLLLAIAFSLEMTTNQLPKLRSRMANVQTESFQVADQFHDMVVDLNVAFLKLKARNDPADQTRFSELSRQMDKWISQQRSQPHSDHEREVIQQINQTYSNYLANAEIILRNKREGHTDFVGQRLPEFQQVSGDLLA